MNSSTTDDDPPSSLYENDTILKFISEMLMEEEDELENQSLTLHHSLALQATEKSLYDALTTTTNNNNVDDHYQNNDHDDQFLHHNQNNTTKNRNREEDDEEEEEYHRSNKQSATNNNNISDSEPLELYDDYLLRSDSGKSKNKSRVKKQDMLVITKEYVDLRSLLMQCAQAVSEFDSRAANNLITQIRQYSSPHGEDDERVAHYFANAIEARLYGNGSALHAAYNIRREPLSVILKTYKMFITACPVLTMSNLFAKQTLLKLADGATTLHIVDFGILFGFQWPCLILALSERPGGPPKLRITGIDFPQPGFRPAEKVEDTGRCLARYCERFKVPFEYNAIAEKWDTIRPEDLKIEKGEVLVVNCLYHLHNVTGEAETVDSPRDAVLKLMKMINPDMFIHGIINATYNTPFFVSRFKEAFFYYSALFDMFQATVAREEDEDQRMRMSFEEQVFGKCVMNIIACEGGDRIERPDTYKQWDIRTRRAGFRQLPIDGKILKCVGKVKKDYYYHKDFSVNKGGEWMVLEWKGRILNAISCWQPVN